MKNPIGPDISVIQKISVAIIHERNVQKLLENVLDILETELGMLRGTFALLFGDTLKIEASRGLEESEKQKGLYRMGEGITGHVAERGISHVIPDLRKDSRFLNRTGSRHYDSQVAFICVPLIHDEQIIGTLSIDRPVDGTTDLDRDVALLEIIANITGDAANECIELHNEQQAMIDENRKLRDMLSNNHGEMVGNCREMQIVYEQLHQVAPSDATVLIRGGSGTGKEMIARAIVNLSGRKDKPFIILNCAALPENLVESELFGHEKGAFTGAMARRIGRAEAADGGTLFLDEIGDLTMQTQVKLLRFLQERTFSRVGSNEEIHADVRFLAATSRNLEELMAQGKFREDLYYRLNIFPIVMPDLAKRKSDIILLAEHFIDKFNVKYGKKITRLSTTAINLLMSYHWPGNVRELENCIERAVLTAKDECVHSFNLPPSLQTSVTSGNGSSIVLTGAPLDVMLQNYEKEILTEAIKQNDGNLSAAGRSLGVSPRMMNYRMNKLGIRSGH
ncbi:sigma 54-interacting transcriptional regulator [Fibrobacter sp. UBA4309]|uniref:sigma 54-interacting transcriptional regulator n=1 Tax=Fibrobacter sp. UBA4309 TaxID=1946537 RepID=UPI0025BC7CFE|nr:sigma 54-interacting transcriptional regulator [Fibrobacter sp. UBA4309]